MTTFNSIFKKWALSLLVGLCLITSANAQIGYQISLLNTATGEARANETVNVTATITDSSGGVIYTGTQSATSNDFGVLSLSVGDADTFTNLDLQQHRLPFFIEVSVNGAMISRSQILSVPVAEVARKLEPQLKLEDVVGTWKNGGEDWEDQLIINSDGTIHYYYYLIYDETSLCYEITGLCLIEGNTVLLYLKEGYDYQSKVYATYLTGLAIAHLYNSELYVGGLDHISGKYSR